MVTAWSWWSLVFIWRSVKSSSTSRPLLKSPVKLFAVPKEEPQSISGAAAMNSNSKVTVEVKIVTKQEAGFVESKQLPIQDLKVADSSGSICLTVWADIVDKLKVDKSYQLRNVSVREYKGKKFLSTSTITEVTPINDIGTVDMPTNDDEFDSENPSKHLKNVQVISADVGPLPSVFQVQL